MSVIRCECGRYVDTDYEECETRPNTDEMICMACYEDEVSPEGLIGMVARLKELTNTYIETYVEQK